jgi:hypothetical protein
VSSALIEIRERALSLAAPTLLPRHIALGKDFALQIGATEAVAWSTSDGREIARVPMKGPRAALGLPAGSVLVAALDASYRFDPGEKRPHPATRLSLLPGFVLEARRGRQDQVWVLQAPLKNLQAYSLNPEGEGGLGIDSERALDDYDGGAFTTLSDGSFLYTHGRELIHRTGARTAKTFTLPESFGAVWRLASADRIDRAWVASAAGELSLVEFGARLRVVRAFHPEAAPFDLATNAKRLALVSVSEPAGEPRRFSLSVYSFDGKRIFSHELSSDAVSADADWVARVTANKEVVIGADPPRVAVGGPSALRVFELDSGRELLSRSAEQKTD